MTSEHALYAIEDILGGHCAVANFAVRALIDVATRPRVQAGVRAELAAVLGEGGQFGLEDKSRLSYLQVLSTALMCSRRIQNTRRVHCKQ